MTDMPAQDADHPEDLQLDTGAAGAAAAAATAAAAPQSDADPSVRISELEAEVASLKDAALRALADAENVRRRTEREKADARAYAVDKFARDLLSVADNLERALASVPQLAREEPAMEGFLTGIDMTGKELVGVFGRHGLIRTGAPGEKFDPALHQAVAQISDPAVPAGDIAQVFAAGYVLNGRTIRAAMVAVSAGPPGAPAATDA
jgi:molecular chaperone GrpE